jgi:hypothetical protein
LGRIDGARQSIPDDEEVDQEGGKERRDDTGEKDEPAGLIHTLLTSKRRAVGVRRC